jgi:hypothetical protein
MQRPVQPSLRDETHLTGNSDPWVETHGYVHEVATRRIPLPAICLPYSPAHPPLACLFFPLPPIPVPAA